MNEEHQEIAANALKGATKAGATAAASSVLTGVGMTTVPVKLFGLITIGTTTVVSMPVVVTIGIAGAVLGGAAAAYAVHRRHKKVKTQFETLLKGDQTQP